MGSSYEVFKITSISAEKFVISFDEEEYTYDAQNHVPAVTVRDASGNVLEKGVDYTVAFPVSSYNAGTYNVNITGRGLYSGVVTKTFTVLPQELKSENIVLSKDSFDYTGKVCKTAVKILNEQGNGISAVYYTLELSGDCIEPGVYTVSLTGNRNYTGTATASFEIK